MYYVMIIAIIRGIFILFLGFIHEHGNDVIIYRQFLESYSIRSC